MTVTIRTFESDNREGVAEAGNPFNLSWTYEGIATRITLKGPDGILADGNDPKYLIGDGKGGGNGSFLLPVGIQDCSTFLLTIADIDGPRSRYLYLSVNNPDRTFNNLTINNTLTLPGA
ncbi:hypothetical protein [Streptomyces wuyuanensis]|uniref:hypothetical protein n=1 Tax=Streptomyces wuyuanensis TaxID=1196353 RepID=UPI003431DAC0